MLGRNTSDKLQLFPYLVRHADMSLSQCSLLPMSMSCWALLLPVAVLLSLLLARGSPSKWLHSLLFYFKEVLQLLPLQVANEKYLLLRAKQGNLTVLRHAECLRVGTVQKRGHQRWRQREFIGTWVLK